MTLLPKDLDNNPIPALKLRDDGAHTIAVSASSNRNSVGFDSNTKVVSLYATDDVYVRFGDSSVAASSSDHFFPAGVYYDIAISGGAGKAAQDLYIAVLQVNGACTLYVSEKQ